ncbi:hypothetical protein FWH30_01710 [Microgenomates group bacterium]|nr:hypothetical protein [Microgenomates group bacterium]
MATFLISLAICIVHTVVVWWRLFYLQPQIPLWYSLAEDNNQLADKKHLWILPIIGGAILLVSLLLKLMVRGDSDAGASKKIIGWVTVVWEVLLLVVTLRIIILVT